MIRNLEHSYTHILAAFEKVKRVRNRIASLRNLDNWIACDHTSEPADIIDQLLEAQQDLLKVIAGMIST